MKIDLHGYHPRDILENDIFTKLVRQAWEMGEPELRLIYGHGRARGRSPGFVNTNTGYFGLEIRRALRNQVELKVWIKRSTLDCSNWGATTIRLKPNANPTRTGLDTDLLPEPRYRR